MRSFQSLIFLLASLILVFSSRSETHQGVKRSTVPFGNVANTLGRFLSTAAIHNTKLVTIGHVELTVQGILALNLPSKSDHLLLLIGGSKSGFGDGKFDLNKLLLLRKTSHRKLRPLQEMRLPLPLQPQAPMPQLLRLMSRLLRPQLQMPPPAQQMLVVVRQMPLPPPTAKRLTLQMPPPAQGMPVRQMPLPPPIVKRPTLRMPPPAQEMLVRQMRLPPPIVKRPTLQMRLPPPTAKRPTLRMPRPAQQMPVRQTPLPPPTVKRLTLQMPPQYLRELAAEWIHTCSSLMIYFTRPPPTR
ncbi:uncharacterized protein MELLADRAFT_95740 [Melampsora larici-populina 98AG31]|uniref:Secreted protein n=1 Tax=Melampsora larici-populina (strain 98AG31 / pathotype 3-4-7) TaxID=747676 RepID=F4SAF6_MELLP|nr:uncharacterized protein MELLADRAFT_95740 [Melampsora larici-populina 98AG31]EGF98386.1 hypothetical protein MELLADRAFT_95740 [Melampsora larici-populina 98AG31]